MKDMLDDIPDDELRRRLRNFEEQPDDDLWNKMEGEIPLPGRPLSEQLKNYTEVPDESVWKGIESGIGFEVAAFRLEVAAGVLTAMSLLLLLMPLVNYRPGHSANRYTLNENSVNAESQLDNGADLRPNDTVAESAVTDANTKALSGDQSTLATTGNDPQQENPITQRDENAESAIVTQPKEKTGSVIPLSTEVEKAKSRKVVQPSSEEKQKNVSKNYASLSVEQENTSISEDEERRFIVRRDEDVSDKLVQPSSAVGKENTSNLVEQRSTEEKQKGISKDDAPLISRKNEKKISKEAIQLSTEQKRENASDNVLRSSSELNQETTSSKNEKGVDATDDFTKATNDKNLSFGNSDNKAKNADEKVLDDQGGNQLVVLNNENVTTNAGLDAVAKDTVSGKDKSRRMAFDLLTKEAAIVDSIVTGDSIPTQVASKQKAKTPETTSEKSKREKSKPSAYGLYALVMPTLGYQEVRPLTQDNIFIESVDRVSAFSPKRLGIRGEIGIERSLARGWGVHAGLLYYQRKQSISYRYNDGTQVDVIELPGDSMSYGVQPRTLSATFEYEVKNIGVLAGFNYSIKGKQFEQRVGMSGELHKPLSRGGEAGGRSTYLFANAYYRLSYRLSRRFDLMLQPTFNYSLQVDNRTNAPFYVKPYGLGLNFGVFYHF
jgi:hypothetical protein